MPRIQDIGAFNAVRESGLAKLVPAVPRLTVAWEPVVAATELKSSSTPSTVPFKPAGSTSNSPE